MGRREVGEGRQHIKMHFQDKNHFCGTWCYRGRGDDSLLPFQEQFPELSVGGFTWHILKPSSILSCVCSLFTSPEQCISTSLYLSLIPNWLSSWISRLACLSCICASTGEARGCSRAAAPVCGFSRNLSPHGKHRLHLASKPWPLETEQFFKLDNKPSNGFNCSLKVLC